MKEACTLLMKIDANCLKLLLVLFNVDWFYIAILVACVEIELFGFLCRNEVKLRS